VIPIPPLGLKDYVIAGLAALCLLLTLNTYLDIHIGPVGFEGWKPKAERMERERDACHTASDQNTAAQKAQKAAYEARYKDLAHDADKQVERAQSDALAATDRYIAAHRVRRDESGVSAPVAAASDSGAGSSDGASPAPELVAVGEEDIRICTTNTIRLEAVRDWALSLSHDPAHP
jgi:hypothetical protein